jgi:capsular exopolysaccharide synthesis family protein
VPLPLLGQIPEAPRGLPFRPAPSPLFPESGYPFLADVYHRLRAHLMMSGAIPPGSASVLITSPEPGTGKSTVTANLGLALAQSGSRVILVDMDLRRPSLHRIFNLPKEPGLSDVLRGETTLNEVLQEGSHKNLRILTAGRVTDDLTGLVTPTQIGAFIENLLEDCDYVLLDAPAVLATADATLLAGQADTILVLAAQRRTDRTNLRQSLQHLHQIGAKVAGVIVNRVPRSRLYAYYSQPSTPVEIIKDRIRRIRTGVK